MVVKLLALCVLNSITKLRKENRLTDQINFKINHTLF